MICSKCGTNNENSRKFCVFCGNNLPVKTENNPSIPELVVPPQTRQPYMPPPVPPAFNQYGQPPQIVGYDPSGMPVYAPPPPPPAFGQYGQPPQIVGYDPSGMPVYAPSPPPPAFSQYGQPPQIVGYDPSGMPVYAPPPPPPAFGQYGQPPQNTYSQPDIPEIPDLPAVPAEDETDILSKKNEDISGDFWAFFDGENPSGHREEQPSEEDFFGKSAHGNAMGDLSTEGLDLNSLRRSDKKKISYMSETPVVDADKLEKHDPSALSQLYMPKTEIVNADDLGENIHKKIRERDRMGATKQVDASQLSANLKVRPRIHMGSAGEADPDTLETYVPEHREAIMAQADHAVEALPKRLNPYESELDAIELPEYMQAKKTKHEEIIEIPSLPELK